MAENIGAQAASAVDEKIREFRSLQEEVNALRSDLGTLMAQRNENEMVKQVRTARAIWVVWHVPIPSGCGSPFLVCLARHCPRRGFAELYTRQC